LRPTRKREKKMEQKFCFTSKVMETGTISKNESISKSHTSSGSTMKKYFFFTFISLCLLACSCRKDDSIKHKINSQGEVVALPWLWKTRIQLKEITPIGTLGQMIIHNGNVLVPTTNGKDIQSLSMLSGKDGKVLWTWNDYEGWGEDVWDFGLWILDHHQHRYRNLFMYSDYNRQYCINLDNGTTQWKKQRAVPFIRRAWGYENTFYLLGNPQTSLSEYDTNMLYKGNMQTGDIEEFLRANPSFNYITSWNSAGGVHSVHYCELVGKPYLAVTSGEPFKPKPNEVEDIYQSYLGLYDLTNNDWVYERQIINQPESNGILFISPIVDKDKICVPILNRLSCFDLATGSRIWERIINRNDFCRFNAMTIVDDRLIAIIEYLYANDIICLDMKTGNIVWPTNIGSHGSFCGQINCLNGIAYFVAGATFFAVEVSTGKVVWRINAEHYEKGGRFHINAVYVLPAENGEPAKVIALTEMNAYCFEAYR